MADASFDIVSKVDHQEADNALNQAAKELSQRFDFRGTDTTIVWAGEEGVTITSTTEERCKAAILRARGDRHPILAGPGDGGVGAAEVEPLRQFLSGLVQGVVRLLVIDLADDVERGICHCVLPSNLRRAVAATPLLSTSFARPPGIRGRRRHSARCASNVGPTGKPAPIGRIHPAELALEEVTAVTSFPDRMR